MKSKRYRLKFVVDADATDDEHAGEIAKQLYAKWNPGVREVEGVLWLFPVADIGPSAPGGHRHWSWLDPPLAPGDRVAHLDSGWAGVITEVAEDDGGMGQGPLVTVAPDSPEGPLEGGKWKPMTVTTAELERVG